MKFSSCWKKKKIICAGRRKDHSRACLSHLLFSPSFHYFFPGLQLPVDWRYADWGPLRGIGGGGVIICDAALFCRQPVCKSGRKNQCVSFSVMRHDWITVSLYKISTMLVKNTYCTLFRWKSSRYIAGFSFSGNAEDFATIRAIDFIS